MHGLFHMLCCHCMDCFSVMAHWWTYTGMYWDTCHICSVIIIYNKSMLCLSYISKQFLSMISVWVWRAQYWIVIVNLSFLNNRWVKGRYIVHYAAMQWYSSSLPYLVIHNYIKYNLNMYMKTSFEISVNYICLENQCNDYFDYWLLNPK